TRAPVGEAGTFFGSLGAAAFITDGLLLEGDFWSRQGLRAPGIEAPERLRARARYVLGPWLDGALVVAPAVEGGYRSDLRYGTFRRSGGDGAVSVATELTLASVTVSTELATRLVGGAGTNGAQVLLEG